MKNTEWRGNERKSTLPFFLAQNKHGFTRHSRLKDNRELFRMRLQMHNGYEQNTLLRRWAPRYDVEDRAQRYYSKTVQEKNTCSCQFWISFSVVLSTPANRSRCPSRPVGKASSSGVRHTACGVWGTVIELLCICEGVRICNAKCGENFSSWCFSALPGNSMGGWYACVWVWRCKTCCWLCFLERLGDFVSVVVEVQF